MKPEKPLPIDPSWPSTEAYVESLLNLVTSSDLLRNLCGGVHILDFLTRQPDLYTWVLPEDWRAWFELVDIDDLLDLLLREPLDQFSSTDNQDASTALWRGGPRPPLSLVEYVDTVRRHSLDRSFRRRSETEQRLPRRIEVGMKPKKIHEVVNFASYVDNLSTYVSEQIGQSPAIVDFGSGQNYLGRTLALSPYDKHVIAIERHHHNVEEARFMDVSAKLSKKDKIMRNKKQYNLERALALESGSKPVDFRLMAHDGGSNVPVLPAKVPDVVLVARDGDEGSIMVEPNKGSMTYIEHELTDGHLEHILYPCNSSTSNSSKHESNASDTTKRSETNLPKSITVSIHSCGNLTHHGIRSLTLNPSVVAIAMIGCCYNLLTERLGPATYKLPHLRSYHPRLEATSNAFDPHGFPMSQKLEDFKFDINTTTAQLDTVAEGKFQRHPQPQAQAQPTARGKGVRLNITARMMAVQAPLNWTPEESALFFTRHFYRALLQRILLDRGVVKQALSPENVHVPGGSLSGKDKQGTPLIIGSLRKTAFTSFPAYVKAALNKLWADPVDGAKIKSMTQDLISPPPPPSQTLPTSDANTDANAGGETKGTIQEYEYKYKYAKKQLSVIWSLMAFSANVVESTIVVDRWLWLTEQTEHVAEAWVETAFGYDQSPRNLVVVGIKKTKENKRQQEKDKEEKTNGTDMDEMP